MKEITQERLDWCVQTERYEMAAHLRDLIEYETTEDENVKTKYYIYAKKYGYWKNPLEVDAREVEKKYLPIVIKYLNETNRK